MSLAEALSQRGICFGCKHFISTKHSGKRVRRRENRLGHPPETCSEWIQTVRVETISIPPPLLLLSLSL